VHSGHRVHQPVVVCTIAVEPDDRVRELRPTSARTSPASAGRPMRRRGASAP